ncbi:MAG: pilus assembly protein [Rickettsiales bacterium]|jgi:Flp pilus assembly protein TadG|nr:pilus assembly protein [Rickettsiales bacterium]
MMKRLYQHLCNLRRREDGIAYVEFATSLPFLLALFMGSVEMTRFIIVSQKVEKSAVTISDVVSQSETIGVTQLNQLISAVGQVMQPYSFGNNGYVIISSVTKTGTNPPRVNWQYTGGGSWTQSSQVGSTGLTATLPNGLTLNDRDTVIIAEVYYNFQPMLVSDVLTSKQLYRVAVFKPRLGDLQTLGS